MDRSSPDSERVRAMLALSLALTGSFDTAAEVADTIPADARTAPWPLAMLVYLDLVQERYLSASDRTLELCELGEGGALARAHLLRTLEYFDRQKPGISWTFCLAGQLLLTSGNIEAAGASVKLCEERCKDEACHQHVQTLKMRINGTDGGVP